MIEDAREEDGGECLARCGGLLSIVRMRGLLLEGVTYISANTHGPKA
jgi:hypothetical protein